MTNREIMEQCDGYCRTCNLKQYYYGVCQGVYPNSPYELKYYLNRSAVTDWSSVPVDTRVWVKDQSDSVWQPKHYAGERNYAFCNGYTSFTGGGVKECWNFMKLDIRDDAGAVSGS